MVEKQCPRFALSAVNFLTAVYGQLLQAVKISKRQPPPRPHSPNPWRLHLRAFSHCTHQHFKTLPTRGKEVPTFTTEATELLRSKSPAGCHPTHPAAVPAGAPDGQPPTAPQRAARTLPPRPRRRLLRPGPFRLRRPFPGPRGQVGPGAPGHTERRGQTKRRRPPPPRYRHERPRATNAGSGPRPEPAAPSSLRGVPTGGRGGPKRLPAMGWEGPRPHARLRRHGDRAEAPRRLGAPFANRLLTAPAAAEEGRGPGPRPPAAPSAPAPPRRGRSPACPHPHPRHPSLLPPPAHRAPLRA